MASTIKENSAQSSVVTQQGQNLKLKGVLNTTKFLRDLLPQRLNAVTALNL
jgi:hypothetical protein